MPKIVMLVLGTVMLLYLFWKRLAFTAERRLFVVATFEVLLIMLFLNIDFWFEDSFALRQLLSWLCLMLSAVFALAGVMAFVRFGRPIEALTGEPHLITQGIFRYIRHPLYSSLIFLTLGILLKHIQVPTLLLAVVSIVFIILTTLREEKQLKETFGSVYIDYVRVTKYFVPFLI